MNYNLIVELIGGKNHTRVIRQAYSKFSHSASSRNKQSGPEILKKSRPKKTRGINKSISRIFFDQNPSFCNFKNAQKSIFELGKSLKLPKMQFHEKKN